MNNTFTFITNMPWSLLIQEAMHSSSPQFLLLAPPVSPGGETLPSLEGLGEEEVELEAMEGEEMRGGGGVETRGEMGEPRGYR